MREQDSIKSAIETLEQLVWLLRGNRLAELDSLVDTLDDWFNTKQSLLSRIPSRSANKNFLIGALPGLFQDQTLFPTNEDIVEFAKSALGIEINRGHKRSRYEIIGRVVCETLKLNENGLTDLVSALEIITSSEESIKKISDKKLAGNFSWNAMIQELVSRKHR